MVTVSTSDRGDVKLCMVQTLHQYAATLHNLTDVTLAVKKQGNAQMSPDEWGHVRGSSQGGATSRPAGSGQLRGVVIRCVSSLQWSWSEGD